MTRIVTTTYRYKLPPRKRKAVAIEAPAVVTAKETATRGRRRPRFRYRPPSQRGSALNQARRTSHSSTASLRRAGSGAGGTPATRGGAGPPTPCGANWCGGRPPRTVIRAVGRG